MNKERRSREDQATALRRMEDSLRYHSGWKLPQQSGGNGNAAGLFAVKIRVMNKTHVVLDYLLRKSRYEAIRAGTEEDFIADIYDIVNSAHIDGITDDPICYHEGNSKKCEAHGHPDWRDCRFLRYTEIQDAKRLDFIAGLRAERSSRL